MTTETHHGIYLEHRTALIDYSARILGSREAAEDIVQDAYMRFAPGKADPVSARQPLAYLYGIVRNLSFDLLKRRKIEAREQDSDPPYWIVPQAAPTPEQNLVLSEQVRITAQVLSELPQDVRIAVEMYRFGGYTLAEVAGHLDVSVATVHRHVRTAMLKIALALDTSIS
ncbi:MAG: sigma-70 family RNA polymerase sigma factor [Shinella sp.]|nr:sigma-70 family RNA polymerase sigma factor [Shinella sp.]